MVAARSAATLFGALYPDTVDGSYIFMDFYGQTQVCQESFYLIVNLKLLKIYQTLASML
ncbi:hypothetical protein Pse7429DRAFT_3851 [Pseudanabaena biceps PCC 7429]|uniref:Uncharacterized protein n=1 Tax=Pseudanabaena biceps PCC 7429 TaxID=927668 RepID=L8MY05_9CYAN|nr:hypothetical protein Pse7429DRAFT_3851 [Pseudanabaena biceps PCC 7429]